MIFLSEEDKSITKESQRDPLGLQPIWAHFGGRVIPNLTTVSDDFRGFRETLLCLDICNAYLQQCKPRQKQPLRDLILFFEQIFMLIMIERKETDGLLGSDAGRRKYKGKDTEISATNPILVNQIGLGYYGRYKTPLYNMKLIDNYSAVLVPQETVEMLFDKKIYRAVRSRMFEFFDKIRQGKSVCWKEYADRKPLYQAVCGELRPGEKEFWLEKMGVADNPLMAACYALPHSEDYRLCFHQLFQETTAPAVEDVLKLEPFLLCMEQVFYKMLGCTSLEGVELTAGELTEYQKRYEAFCQIRMQTKSEILKKRFDALHSCDPRASDYVSRVFKYHCIVCEQKGKARWLDIDATGRIQSFNQAGQVSDLDQWNRSYYLRSLFHIKAGIEAQEHE